MALVGMASKPLHVRRLQKALQEWVSNPREFSLCVAGGGSLGPMANNTSSSNHHLDNAVPPYSKTPLSVPLVTPPSSGAACSTKNASNISCSSSSSSSSSSGCGISCNGSSVRGVSSETKMNRHNLMTNTFNKLPENVASVPREHIVTSKDAKDYSPEPSSTTSDEYSTSSNKFMKSMNHGSSITSSPISCENIESSKQFTYRSGNHFHHSNIPSPSSDYGFYRPSQISMAKVNNSQANKSISANSYPIAPSAEFAVGRTQIKLSNSCSNDSWLNQSRSRSIPNDELVKIRPVCISTPENMKPLNLDETSSRHSSRSSSPIEVAEISDTIERSSNQSPSPVIFKEVQYNLRRKRDGSTHGPIPKLQKLDSEFLQKFNGKIQNEIPVSQFAELHSSNSFSPMIPNLTSSPRSHTSSTINNQQSVTLAASKSFTEHKSPMPSFYQSVPDNTPVSQINTSTVPSPHLLSSASHQTHSNYVAPPSLQSSQPIMSKLPLIMRHIDTNNSPYVPTHSTNNNSSITHLNQQFQGTDQIYKIWGELLNHMNGVGNQHLLGTAAIASDKETAGVAIKKEMFTPNLSSRNSKY